LIVLALLGATTRVARADAMITVQTVPEGARVTIDGSTIGVTPLEYGLLPGRHVVVIDASGYERVTRTVVAAADEPTTVQVALTAEHVQVGLLAPLKWTAAAVAAGGISLGAYLLATDGPSFARDGARMRDEHDNAALGWTSLAVGAGAAALAAYGFIEGGRSAQVAAAAALGPGGGALWVRGSF
jgi:hypothetical protein